MGGWFENVSILLLKRKKNSSILYQGFCNIYVTIFPEKNALKHKLFQSSGAGMYIVFLDSLIEMYIIFADISQPSPILTN